LITILVGRVAGPVELGRYTVAFSILVLLGCAQEALLTTPYAICAPRLRKRARTALSDAVVAMHGLLIATVALIGLFVILVEYLLASDAAIFQMTVALTIAAPLSLAWEFSRRMMLAQLRVMSAAIVDATAAVLQIGLLLALFVLARLDGATAAAVLGLGCALPAAICLAPLLPQRRPRRLALYWQRHWRVGKWIMGSQMVRAMSSVLPIWILASLAGDPAAGIFAACVSIPMISNPLIFAMGNLLMPKAAHALASTGVAGVVRLILRGIAAVTLLLLPLGLAMLLAGESILQLLYGTQYTGQGPTLAVLGLCPIVWAATSVLACGQAALRQTKASFVATVCGVLVCALVIAALATAWQVLGGAIGLLAGSLTMCALQAWQFSQRCREFSR
jgi:O-antigen/teichoic acid export membrane protein